MDENSFKTLMKIMGLLLDPDVTNHVKNETVKIVLKQIVDNQPIFGELTKKDLKDMIEVSSNWESLYFAAYNYCNTHYLWM